MIIRDRSLISRVETRILRAPADGAGVHGLVYFIDSLACKKLIYLDTESPRNGSLLGNALWEAEVGMACYAAGIQVPRMYGVIEGPEPIIVMERIVGERPIDIANDGVAVKRCVQQFDEQKGRITACGFTFDDREATGNVIYSHEQGKIYFIDFARWRRH